MAGATLANNARSVSDAAGAIREAKARRYRRAAVLKHAFLIVTSLVVTYPLLWMLARSLDESGGQAGSLSLWPSGLRWENYSDGWFALAVSFTSFFINSTVVTVLCVTGNVISCSFAAYAFARLEFTGKTIWFALMMVTMMVPYHAVLIPQYLFFYDLGWTNSWLPLVVPRFLAGDAFFIFLMVQFFRQLPREIDEAAEIDGCSPYKIYWAIVLPLSVPAMLTAALFSFVWTWADFLAPLVYLNDLRDYTVPLALSVFPGENGTAEHGQMLAMSVLSLLPVALFFIVFQRLFARGVVLGRFR